MLVRIVKLKFKTENISSFERIFEETSEAIRNQPGCQFLELYQDKNDAAIFFTYSYWEDEASLNAYRHSKFFKEVWSKTKLLFKDRPEAWSVEKKAILN
ncbi:Antibiotic biosynthesis monooxygenase [Croceitalea dokdonensis DOKDO 023]|uniref:Antibiotic biosynthesis monooxygenase n=1 Tax=Croceitalea dokdonensis DOKDO 023 TaxID=1300341 RepID=A0A0P7B2V5_9FLAO|nr:antibiotic biosynthesis monooxygenase family protein [Croceitalea dokdonensis]KPM33849.1 Antibiotic biosynthesis monooxygenase [Croceitalea dokdonensis DOKDO 023]